MIVYRLCKTSYAHDLTGKGAEKSGGRWNNKGTAILYTGETRALCTTEIAVHTPLGLIPEDFSLVSIEIPDKIKIHVLTSESLNPCWNCFPPTHETQQIGDIFVREGRFAVLKVPSATVQGEFNYLVNPAHKDSPKIEVIKTEAFRFDQRLFRPYK